MAITLTKIITVDEYIEVYPQDANVEEDLIQSAINRATITLDAICGGLIAQVWGVTDPTSTYYRTDEEKNYIKQAHCIQAQYNVSRNLDMSAGTESYTSGSNNYNETRPRADMIADEIIYQLLAKGRVYNPNITSNTTIKQVGGVEDGFYDPSYDPGDEYITYNVGDLRYVPRNYPTGANKFLKMDENGNISYVSLGELHVSWGDIDGTITNQQDLVDYITTRLSGYATEQWVTDNYYGRYQYVEGTEGTTTLNVTQITELIGAGGGVYLGSQQGTLQDVSSDENASKFIGDYLGITTEIVKNSYFHITIATNDVYNEDIYRYIATGNKIDIGGVQYYEYKFGFKYVGDLSLLKQQVETNTNNILTLQQQVAAIGGVLFPIGSIYTTFTNTNPSTLLGFGTWESIGTTYIPSSKSVSVSGTVSLSGTAPVYGTGKALGLYDGSTRGGIFASNSSQSPIQISPGLFGESVGTSFSSGFINNNKALGVVTSGTSGLQCSLSSASGSATMSGSITANQIYMWKRTA